MMFFLQLVAAMFVALLILILIVYLYIKWKVRSVLANFAEAIKGIGAAAVPPFRVKLRTRSDVFEDDDEFDSENRETFEECCREFETLGFEKIDDYYVEEIPLALTAFVNRDTSTYGIVYDHPMVVEPYTGVWCDVVRRYEDGSGWTFGTNKDSLMDAPLNKTIKYFPELSLTEVVEKFHHEAPRENAILVADEEFPKFFERAYAEEMDWRIGRGGATEAEIRRIAERDEVECTPQHIRSIQMQWRMAISEFHRERVLRRYRKANHLPRSEWDQLDEDGIVIHSEMQAEEILQAFDDEYYPGDVGLVFDEEDDDSDPEYQAERAKWNRRLEDIREQLKTDPPQVIYRRMVENSNHPDFEWEFQASVEEPLAADIWLRTWKDDSDDGMYGEDDDDWDE